MGIRGGRRGGNVVLEWDGDRVDRAADGERAIVGVLYVHPAFGVFGMGAGSLIPLGAIIYLRGGEQNE